MEKTIEVTQEKLQEILDHNQAMSEIIIDEDTDCETRDFARSLLIDDTNLIVVT